MELLILFEQWAGHRLLSEKVIRPHVRAGRPILLPSVPVSEGIEIRHGCQFLSSLLRALGKLPGGIGRLLPLQARFSFIQVKACWLESMFSWLGLQAIRIFAIISALRLFAGCWGILRVQLWSFWMAL